MSEIRNLLKTSGYSDRAIEYYENHVNVGSIENPDAHAIFTGPCGDTIEIFLKITSDIITDAKFQAIGCAGSFTSGSALTKMITGKTVKDCEKLDENDVLNHLSKIPEQKVHCARLTVLTLKKAIEQFKKKEVKMKKIIAIPLENRVLCAHFGHCQTFAIVIVENNLITEVKEVTPPEHVPGLYPKWVAEFGVTDVIAGGMGQQAIMLFNQQKINAFVGAPIKSAKELVTDFLTNKLSLSANYCNHNEHSEHGNCEH